MKKLTRTEIKNFSRRTLRYYLYRIRTAEEGGAEIPEEAIAVKKFFESQEGVNDWSQFARSWDVRSDENYDRITLRGKTEEEEWNEELRTIAKPLPNLEINFGLLNYGDKSTIQS